MGEEAFYIKTKTPIGDLFICTMNEKICSILLGKDSLREFEGKTGLKLVEKETMASKNLAEKLKKYFKGRKTFLTERIIFPYGTAFEKRVWKETMKIPWGETRSYSWIAEKTGKEKAFRAVGRALSKNPLLIAVPCHRVIKKDGSLGGFSNGVETKRKLLSIEGKEI